MIITCKDNGGSTYLEWLDKRLYGLVILNHVLEDPKHDLETVDALNEGGTLGGCTMCHTWLS